MKVGLHKLWQDHCMISVIIFQCLDECYLAFWPLILNN